MLRRTVYPWSGQNHVELAASVPRVTLLNTKHQTVNGLEHLLDRLRELLLLVSPYKQYHLSIRQSTRTSCNPSTRFIILYPPNHLSIHAFIL